MRDLAKAQKVCLQHEARSKAFMVEVEVTISSFVKDTSRGTPACLKMFGFANIWHLARHENFKCTCYLRLYEAWLVLKYVPSHLSTGLLKENTTFWLYLLMPFSNAAMTLCSQSNRFIGTRCIRFFNHSTLLIYIRNKLKIFHTWPNWMLNILKWHAKRLFSLHDLMSLPFQRLIAHGLLLHGRLLRQQMQGLVPLHLGNSCTQGIVGHQVLEKWLYS